MVRIVSLSGGWLEDLPLDEKAQVRSMIGEVFEVEEIDEYGSPWVCKQWPENDQGESLSHSLALRADEMESVASPLETNP